MIRSPVVLGECLSQSQIAQMPELKVQLDPLKWATKRLSIASVADSELFLVKFKGPNPVNAAKIVNAIVDTYLKHHRDVAHEEAQRMIEILDRLKAERIHELERLQERVRALTKKVTGRDIVDTRRPRDGATTVNPLAALESRLTEIEVSKEVLEVQYEAARQSLEAKENVAVPARLLEQAVSSHPEVAAMNGELQGIRTEIREYEHTSANPQQLEAVKKLTKRLTTVEKSLAERKQQIRKESTKDLQEGLLADERARVEGLADELKKQRTYNDQLRERLAAQKGEMEKYGDEALNLEFARSEMERAEEVFRRLSDRITALQTEKSAEARVSALSAAVAPVDPLTTPLKFIAGAGGVSFVLPFALALLWEIRVRRIATVEQLRDEARLPIIGEITSLPTRSLLPGRRAAARLERQRSIFDESISQLRTSLVLCDDASDLQVIAVASAVSREGKTSTAAQLAANLAKASNEPTLVVDADLRNPDIHDVFGIALEPGLAEVLSQQVSLDEAVVPSSTPSVWVIPAGRAAISPHTLFCNGAFSSLLQVLRSQYRYIVIDCPPLLAASESLVVARAADGAILCTMRDVSRASQVREARDRLLRAGARPLGVVLNNVSARSYATRYGGYGYATARTDGADRQFAVNDEDD